MVDTTEGQTGILQVGKDGAKPDEWFRSEVKGRLNGKGLDEETSELLDSYQEVFEQTPSYGVIQRAAKHYIKLLPGETPQ